MIPTLQRRLLRLYPHSWRDRYEAEFLDLLEARPATLPDLIDILRGALDAHLHPLAGVRRGIAVEGGAMTTEMLAAPDRPLRYHLAWIYWGMLVSILVLYLGLAVVPFYANSLALHARNEILDDPKSLPPFAWAGAYSFLSGILTCIGALSFGFGPLLSLPLSLVLVGLAARQHEPLAPGTRRLWLATVVGAAVLFAATWPARELILFWLGD